MDLPDIVKMMRKGEPIPVDSLDLMLVRCAGEYAYYASMLETVLVEKPTKWSEMRGKEGIKSDTQADRLWEASEDGRNEIGLRLRMKAIEKMLSALRSMAETARRELLNTKYS